MWILHFVLVVLICQTCSLAGQVGYEPKEEAKDAILDLSNPDNSSINVLKWNPYSIDTRISSAKDGYRISSVVDGGERIWTSSGHPCEHVVTAFYNGDTTGLIIIYTRNKEGTKIPLYYKKVGSDWKGVDEDTFYSSFHAEAIKESILETLTLDVMGKNDPAKFYINGSPKFPFAVYAPGAGYRIAKVTCGTISRGDENMPCTVWNAMSSYEGCLYASLYPREDPIVAYLIIETSDGMYELYYHRVGNEWVSALKNEYKLGLYTNGFNESAFSNEVTADLSRPDRGMFYIREFQIDKYTAHLYRPCVGLRLNRIVDNGEEVWKAEEGEHCTYLNVVFKDKKPFTFFILIDDPKNGRSVLYFVKEGGLWKVVRKEEYYDSLLHRGNPIYTHQGNGKITMSSFRNRQGLRLTSYASTVDNAKGDIILVHGLRSHFVSEFCTSNTEWNFERFGSPASLDINGVFIRKDDHKISNSARYRHLFEHASLEGKDALEVFPRYQYGDSLVEFLNKLGYNVYGYDHQSHGLSESISASRCHAKNCEDYVRDLIQFISIVRRGKFEDSSETWDEGTIFQDVRSGKKIIMFGHSMGGNIAIQAIQEFYKKVKNPQAKLVDGLIVTSGMFYVKHYLDTDLKRLMKKMAPVILWLVPENLHKDSKSFDYGDTFDLFLRYLDPFFYANSLTYQTCASMLDACDDVKKEENMAHYPMSLPTLFLHSKYDSICDAKGTRDLMNKYFKENKNVKYVELDGSLHHLTLDQGMMVLQPHLKEWLDKYT